MSNLGINYYAKTKKRMWYDWDPSTPKVWPNQGGHPTNHHHVSEITK